MKKLFLKFLFGLAMLVLIATLFLPLNGKIVEEIDAGIVMSVEEVSTSWNDLQRTRVETDDGTTKNDCERHAAKRLAAQLRQDHPHFKLIVTEDSLTANG